MAPQQSTVFKRYVELGRIVLINDEKSPSKGKLATIVQIIDHNRALIDGPSIPRQEIVYRSLVLTPYTIPSLPLAAGTGAVRKAFEKAGVEAKWAESAWAKKLKAREVRKASSDFERFEISVQKRQRRDLVRKAAFKERKATKA